MIESTQLPRTSLHDALTPGLRELIRDGNLKPGDKISEPRLCEHFGVSRTPLREALKVLAAEGLIELLPRRGAVVAQISAEDIRELFPIMAALEGLAGELACERITDADIDHMRALHAQMMDAYQLGNEDAYLKLNRQIHEAIFTIARNDTLAAMYQQILARMHSHRFIVRKSETNWKNAVEDHERIMEALAARDKHRLPQLLRTHVTGTTAAIAHEYLARLATTS
ncbi:GntR family transcriptional regulator [Beijerinckia sp. L45]|uniref:GntR family transcriptional regulator n=1 Tax=Beijerinckia sp. L45 TaxID=1641855 RepID=UPI00131BAB0B|nr:GntR family transcriptional regulator [Beijerinckia sp. L45]